MRPSGKKPRRIPEFSSESERGEFYLNKALYYLEFKMRTEAEVRTYLKEWQCPEDVLEDVILFLEEYHYLDDARYAESFIRQEREFSHRSRRDIINRLKAKGVSDELISAAFSADADTDEEESPVDPELEQCLILVRKRMKAGKTDRDKMISFLQRRGFTYGTIKQSLAEAELNADEYYEP